MLQSLQNIDLNLLKLIHDNLQNPVLDKIVPIITALGNGGIVWIIISVILMITKKYRKIGLMCAAALIVNTIIGEGILKHTFQRQRPFTEVAGINLLVSKPSSYSFPSGHTSTAFAAAIVLASQLKKYKVHLMTIAGLLAFSRLYLFVHYPSDVLAGIIVGLISAKLVLKFYPADKKYEVCEEKITIED